MSNSHSFIFRGLLFIFGLFWGSFANVCIFRWPRNQTIYRPIRSFCPWCKKQISWFDNIPLLSFIFLKGRCRQCKGTISWKYPFVEFSLAVLWVSLFFALSEMAPPAHPIFIVAILILAFNLLVAGMTDLEWKIIPDQTSLSLIIIGLLTSPWNPFFQKAWWLPNLLDSIIGFLAGGGILILIATVGRWFFGKEVMGWGDIKLFAGIGTFLGWEGIIISGVCGSIAGGIFSIIGLLSGFLRRHQYIPFGPFLIFGTLITIFLFVNQSVSLFDLIFFQ